MTHPLQTFGTHQRGVGLVEVLVAVLVVAFGMLGMVSLQLFTLRNNQSSLERGMAVAQSHSIIDAMHADRTNAINDLFDIGLGDAAPTGTTFREVALASWRADLVAALGAGATGAVNCNGSLCTVTIRWDDARAGGSDSHTVTTEVQL